MLAGGALALASPSRAPAQGVPSPVGGEIQVNTTTDLRQHSPAVAARPGKGFVVAWASVAAEYCYSSGCPGHGVFVQRFDRAGIALGGEFQVANPIPYDYGFVDPAVARDAAGDFVVSWMENYFDKQYGASLGAVFLRRYDRFGVPLAAPRLLDGLGGAADVDKSASGSFVVSWLDHPYGRVLAQPFNADGTPSTPLVTVTPTTHSVLGNLPKVAVQTSGGFVVVWGEFDGFYAPYPFPEQYAVTGRRFAADGTPLDSEFTVDSGTVTKPFSPNVAATPDGGFLVVWRAQAGGTGTSNRNVFFRKYEADGTSDGIAVLVGDSAITRTNPAIAVEPDGSFTITWSSADGSSSGVFARSFSPSGIPSGDEFQVNTFTTGFQRHPQVATNGQGEFMVVWATQKSTSDIAGQLFRNAEVFSDGFENGDTGGWSAVVP